MVNTSCNLTRTPFDFENNCLHDFDKDQCGIQEPGMSFLGFDVRELDEDLTILRGLHGISEFTCPSEDFSGTNPTSAVATDSMPPPPSSPASKAPVLPNVKKKRRRRNRVRRLCTIEGCTNRVVQGGVCVTHGAKRKTCKYPDCDKSVKKAGFCSTHGPARKRCEILGCCRVAVQGGICIGHGAKKNPCKAEGCRRLAIMDGVCKAHCGELGHASSPTASVVLEQVSEYCLEIPNLAVAAAVAQAPVPSLAFQKTMYARQLSIFEEMGGASEPAVGNPLPPPPTLAQQQGQGHRSILSRDLQSLCDEDLFFKIFETI